MVERSYPRVTVTIPTYNRAGLLAEAIRSVLDQSMEDIEVFVSDNASTDETAAVAASFDDPRLHYVRNDTNIGHLANMSRGLRLGSAPYLTILPDDDVMLPGNLELKVRLLEDHPEVGVAHSASRLVHVDQGGRVVETHLNLTGGEESAIETAPQVMLRLLTNSYWINFPTALIRRSLVAGIAFDAEDGLADDLGMFLRIVRRAEAVAYISDPLVSLRMHSQALSSQAGFHRFLSGTFTTTPLAIAHIREVRERFLSQYGHEFENPAGIRAASRRWIRKRLLTETEQNIRGQPYLTSLRLLGEAARVEPAILGTRRGMRLLAKTVAGPRGRALGRRILGRRRGSQRPTDRADRPSAYLLPLPLVTTASHAVEALTDYPLA